MSKIKTLVNDASVLDFINTADSSQKKQDSLILLELFKKVTGLEPKMWGGSIVGFGSYHYKSQRSSQEGDWLITGFSPRKQAISLYLTCNIDDYKNELKALGKHKTGVGCLYVNKLEDIDLTVLESLIKKAYEDAKKKLT